MPDVVGGGRRGGRGLLALDGALARRGRLSQTLTPDLLCPCHDRPQVILDEKTVNLKLSGSELYYKNF